ncbi:hypothetical protein SAMN02745857_03340 [Andreprevotia lacus DSM 23236]|jgi:CubicO group peptidase (beta-lactamase class C family)|uniref:Beta-lactamase-related domain-containing protein n=1 Tax=Andreprevotia lacus DSM 23236 TaxID=1121001 RepID=A0A1W1XXN6_9NEIS|nr:serine hydrolase [Andreprevotia lacus]SMC28617.1 hypothetical protein SAMN02745857_03340 [Andreprevotia lacus DSM 23236]
MRPTRLLSLALFVQLAGCTWLLPAQPQQVASGFTSHLICSEAFVSGLDPARVYAERIAPTGSMWLLGDALHYRVDRERQLVAADVAGHYPNTAYYRPGSGCTLGAIPPQVDNPPATSADAVLVPATPALAHVLDLAFAERTQPPHIATHAVVIMKNGRIVAERYAPGIGPDTPLLGFSASKSVTNALFGILVRQGTLSVQQPAPLSEWQHDGRSAITIDQLLRQTSGLDLPQTNSGFDATSRMSFIERDMAGFAASRPLAHAPGSHWDYTDGNYLLLSRILRDAAGGDAAAVHRFADRELFGPLGMRNVTMEFDPTGTPSGAAFMLMPARSWARFGQLYLDDGMANGQRILPEGWARYSASRTLDTGYGAGFWTNQADGDGPWGLPWGFPSAPRDTLFAMGYMGQFVIVMPSEKLVIVRLGAAHHPDGLQPGMDRVIAAAISATRGQAN